MWMITMNQSPPRMPIHCFHFVTCIVALWLGMMGAGISEAAEIQLLAHARCSDSMIRLGTIAKILPQPTEKTEDIERLEATVLFPAPLPGTKRCVRFPQIRDVLSLRGVSVIDHRFTGAGEILIEGEKRRHEVKKTTPMTVSRVEQMEQSIGEEITAYLRENLSDEKGWEVEVRLDPQKAASLKMLGKIKSVEGGVTPWTGRQQFTLTYDRYDPESNTPVRMSVDALVTLAPQVVVMKRSVARGMLLSEADVTLSRAENENGKGFPHIEEVVGKEASRTLSAGMVVEPSMIQAPVIVERNSVVTVYSRAPGIVVELMGRAKENGAMGDLVTVESSTHRRTFLARVCGHGEVEIMATATSSTANLPSERRPLRNVAPVSGSLDTSTKRDVIQSGYREPVVETRRQEGSEMQTVSHRAPSHSASRHLPSPSSHAGSNVESTVLSSPTTTSPTGRIPLAGSPGLRLLSRRARPQ